VKFLPLLGLLVCVSAALGQSNSSFYVSTKGNDSNPGTEAAPWRTVQYNDLDEVENEIWEYRGRDSSGTFRVHIEFDHHDVVRIVGKIPDDVPGGRGTPAKS